MRATSTLFGLAPLCSLLLATPSASAEVVQLRALERMAVQNRPTLAAGQARTRAARAELEQARSAYNPTLSLEAQTSLGPGRELVRIPTAEGDVFVQGARAFDGDDEGGIDGDALVPSWRNELDLQLKSNLYDFGRTSAAVDAGRAQHASAQAEQEATRDAIVLSVRAAYLGWLGQSELLAIAEQATAEAERRSQRVQALIEEGARPQAELSIARADEMLAKLELERARGALRAARLQLEHTVGSKLAPAAEPDRALLEPEAAPAAPDSTDDATLRALALKQQAARAEARRREHADAPVLAGAVSAGVRTHSDLDDDDPDDDDEPHDIFPGYALGLSFSLPLLDGGGTDAAASAARARAEALAAELEAARSQRRNERERAALDRDNARAQLQTADALLAVVNQRVSEAEQSYELGASGLEPLAQARALLRRAQTELLHAKLALAEAQLRLSR